jgi:phage shock protein PspC (stress-responsive transcriptional regulator)
VPSQWSTWTHRTTYPPLPGTDGSDGVGILAGVASGVADHFALDPTLVRIGFVLLALFGGMAVPLYLAAWVVIPDEGSDRSLAEEWCGRDPIGGVHG